MSHHTLDNKIISNINSNALNITKIYKNQSLPSKTTKTFKDNLFPPNNESLLGMKHNEPVDKVTQRLNKLKSEFMYDPDNIIWLRAKDIFNNGKYSIFVDNVCIDDVRQGSLGNCYFMSSLAAMTQMPQLIYQIFKTNQIPINNCYQIAMNIDGEWQIVLLDDYFPCSKKTHIPIFAKPNGPELWAMLLEKAWAKINGGYLNITGGLPREVLSVLTPFPIETITLKHRNCFKTVDDISIWNKVTTAFNENSIISSCSNFNDNNIEQYGLISGHAFTITDITEGFVNGDLVRLVRLRNPWGYREWNGPWSDKSPLWTKQAKKELKKEVIVNDDGEFWMCFEDFLKYFCVVDICKIMNPQCVKSVVIAHTHVELPNVYEMHIYSRTKCVISVYKKTYRFHRTLNTDEELAVNVMIYKKGKDNYIELISSINKNITNPTISVELPVGFYLIYVYCNYKYSTYKKVRKVRMYISCNKYFTLYYKGIDNEHNLLKHCIYHHIRDEILRTSNKKEILGIHTQNKYDKTTYGYILIQNKTKETLRLTVKNTSQNFQLFSPFKSDLNEVDISLHSLSIAVFVGIRKQYYEEYKISLEITIHSTLSSVPVYLAIQNSLNKISNDILELPNKCNNTNAVLLRANVINENTVYPMLYELTPSQIEMFVNNENDVDINEDSDYDFIFKVIDVDKERIAEKIDYQLHAQEYFLKKYPKEMTLILKEVEVVGDGKDVIFRDVFDYGDLYYLGEWKMKEDLTRHGRGLIVYADHSRFIGQFVNDKREGVGKFISSVGDVTEIKYKNDKMDGIGVVHKMDGSVKKVFYQEGKFIC